MNGTKSLKLTYIATKNPKSNRRSYERGCLNIFFQDNKSKFVCPNNF